MIVSNFKKIKINIYMTCTSRWQQQQKSMDLLGSILGSMQKPPSVGDAERKKAKGCYFCVAQNNPTQVIILILNVCP